MERRIFIYGSGNMAWALAMGFQKAGIKVAGICGRNQEHVIELTNCLGLDYCNDITKQSKKDDIIFFAVKDDAISLLNKSLHLSGRIVLHTAGSVDINAIKDISENIGVFYPMERVIKFKEPNFKKTPLCIEGNNQLVLEIIQPLAHKLSEHVHLLSSHQRKNLHIAAVFVSNFTTYMLSIGNDIIQQHHLPNDILDALIRITFDNITSQNASDRQTGPAKRGDIKVVWEHIHQLEKEQPDIAELYKLLSLGILKRYNLSSEL